MAHINKIMIIGNLADKPQLFADNDTKKPMAVARVATNETWKDKATGQKVKRTTWFDVIMFGERARAFHEWTNKGQQVYLEGRMEERPYKSRPAVHVCTDANGNPIINQQTGQPYQTYVVVERKQLKLVATDWEFMDAKPADNSAYAGNANAGAANPNLFMGATGAPATGTGAPNPQNLGFNVNNNGVQQTQGFVVPPATGVPAGV